MYELTAEDHNMFERELAQRREAVYGVLFNPDYAANFEPRDTHDAIYNYLRRQGKALRPLMALLACGAAGGDEARALPAAAAVELFHTWTLVHDDIIDRDDSRRGSPTVHAAFATRARDELGYPDDEAYHYGVTVAILAGDQQQGWAYSLLSRLPDGGVSPTLALELVRELALDVEVKLLAGEMLDVQFSRQPIETLSEDQVIDMLSRKTAVLYRFAARTGARIGLEHAGDAADSRGLVAALGNFAASCGIAFQLQDDLLGIVGDEKLFGKPFGSDLREGKKTVIIFHALKHATPEQQATLYEVLGNQSATREEIMKVVALLEELGSLSYVRSMADKYVQDAMTELSRLPNTPERKLLYLWARYLVSRDF